MTLAGICDLGTRSVYAARQILMPRLDAAMHSNINTGDTPPRSTQELGIWRTGDHNVIQFVSDCRFVDIPCGSSAESTQSWTRGVHFVLENLMCYALGPEWLGAFVRLRQSNLIMVKQCTDI